MEQLGRLIPVPCNEAVFSWTADIVLIFPGNQIGITSAVHDTVVISS
jgi:hypothetical protein